MLHLLLLAERVYIPATRPQFYLEHAQQHLLLVIANPGGHRLLGVGAPSLVGAALLYFELAAGAAGTEADSGAFGE